MRGRLSAFALCVIAAAGSVGFGQTHDSDQPHRTLQVYGLLAQAAAGRAAGIVSDTGSVDVSIRPDNLAWIIRGEFLRGLASGGLRPSPDPASRYSSEIGITGMHVTYDRVSGGGLFGEQLLRRQVMLRLTGVVQDREAGISFAIPELVESWSDTIRADDLERIEQPGIAETRGSVPPPGFFDSFAEPVIAIGAIAVAVYLLFTVRS